MKVGVQWLLLISLLNVAACTGLQKKHSIHNEVFDQSDRASVEVDANGDSLSADVDPDIPLLELDEQTLEQLLIQNFASYYGNWSLGSKSALIAAKKSGDYRLAKSATLLALHAKDYARVLDGATLWSELKADAAQAKELIFVSQVGLGNVEAAIQTLEAQNKANDLVHLDEKLEEVSALLLRQSNGGAAVALMLDFINKNPDSAQAYLSAAYIAEVFKEYSEAQSWLDQAIALKPDWELAAQMKADILQSRGHIDEREAFVKQYVSDNPDSVPMSINYAVILSRHERYQDAYVLMKAVVKKNPRHSGALNYTGALAGQLEEVSQAKYYFEQALHADPQNDDARWSLGRLAAFNKKYITATKYFNGITTQDKYIAAQIQVANMRYHTDGLKRAVATLSLLEPQTEQEYVDIALTRHSLLLGENQYEEAFSYINEVMLYSPDDLDLLYARALVAAELKKVDVAEKDLRAILAVNPDSSDALNALGYTLADQTDRYEEAKVMIAKALELRPETSHILDSMGWVLYRLKDYSGAIEFLQKAYMKNKGAEIAAHLGEVLWVSGDQQQATAIWQEAYNEDADNLVLNATLELFNVSLVAK